MMTLPEVTQSIKWCSFTLRCLVLALRFWNISISNAPILSLKTLHVTLGVVGYIRNPVLLRSFRSCTVEITSLITYDSPMYSDFVLNSLISVCNWYFYTKSLTAYINIWPNMDPTVSLSNGSYMSQFLKELACTQTYRYFSYLVLIAHPYLGSLLGIFPSISKIESATSQGMTYILSIDGKCVLYMVMIPSPASSTSQSLFCSENIHCAVHILNVYSALLMTFLDCP